MDNITITITQKVKSIGRLQDIVKYAENLSYLGDKSITLKFEAVEIFSPSIIKNIEDLGEDLFEDLDKEFDVYAIQELVENTEEIKRNMAGYIAEPILSNQPTK